MFALLLCTNDEDRDYFGFVLRQSGLTVRNWGAGAEEGGHNLVLIVPESGAAALSHVRRFRDLSTAPLLLLLEAVDEADHCALLDAGADLVLLRPISPRVLSRYIRSLLARSGAGDMPVLTRLEVAGIRLNPATRQVHVGERPPTPLTPLEFRLLYVLMSHAGQVLPLDIIVERVWGYSGEGNRELVRGLVRRLRRKLGDDPERPPYIHNTPGVGYRFEAG